MRTSGIIASLLIVGVCLGGIRVMGTLKAGGVFIDVETDYDQACIRVTGIPGPEDVVIDRSTGVVFVSSYDRRTHFAFDGADNDLRGGIFAWDPERPSLGFVELTALRGGEAGPADFRPHGMSLYTAPDGAKTLMVINHTEQKKTVNHPRETKNTVEIYDIVDRVAGEGDPETVRNALPRLSYRHTVDSPSLISPNDLVAVDSERFYTTNDHGLTNEYLKMAEDFLRLNLGSVIYFDGHVFSQVLSGLTYANGIEISASGDTIYVAETTDSRVGAYSVDAASGDLELDREWNLGFGVDNIDRSVDGSLLIGGHPKMLDFLQHSLDPAVMSPGKVVRIVPDSDEAPETIFQTDGDLYSGLSVAVEHDGRIVMGQVFDDALLVCE